MAHHRRQRSLPGSPMASSASEHIDVIDSLRNALQQSRSREERLAAELAGRRRSRGRAVRTTTTGTGRRTTSSSPTPQADENADDDANRVVVSSADDDALVSPRSVPAAVVSVEPPPPQPPQQSLSSATLPQLPMVKTIITNDDGRSPTSVVNSPRSSPFSSFDDEDMPMDEKIALQERSISAEERRRRAEEQQRERDAAVQERELDVLRERSKRQSKEIARLRSELVKNQYHQRSQRLPQPQRQWEPQEAGGRHRDGYGSDGGGPMTRQQLSRPQVAGSDSASGAEHPQQQRSRTHQPLTPPTQQRRSRSFDSSSVGGKSAFDDASPPPLSPSPRAPSVDSARAAAPVKWREQRRRMQKRRQMHPNQPQQLVSPPSSPRSGVGSDRPAAAPASPCAGGGRLSPPPSPGERKKSLLRKLMHVVEAEFGEANSDGVGGNKHGEEEKRDPGSETDPSIAEDERHFLDKVRLVLDAKQMKHREALSEVEQRLRGARAAQAKTKAREDELAKEVESLKSALDGSERKRDRLSASLEESAKSLTVRCNELKRQMSEVESERDELRCTNEEQREEHERSIIAIQRVLADVTSSRDIRVEELEQRVEELIKEKQSWSGDCGAPEEKGKLESYVENLEARLAGSRTEADELRGIVAELEATLNTVMKEREDRRAREEELARQLEASQQLKAAKAVLHDDMRSVDKSDERLGELQAEVDSIRSQHTDIVAERDMLQADLLEKEISLESAKKIIASLETANASKLKEREVEIESIRRRANDEQTRGYQKEIVALKSTNDWLRADLEEQRERAAQLEKAASTHREEIDRAASAITQMQRDKEETVIACQSEIQHLRDQCFANMGLLAKKEQELQVLRQSLADPGEVGYVSDDDDDNDECDDYVAKGSPSLPSAAETFEVTYVQGNRVPQPILENEGEDTDALQHQVSLLKNEKEKATKELQIQKDNLANAKMIISSLERSNKSMIENLRSRLQDSNTAISSLLDKSSKNEQTTNSLREEMVELRKSKDEEACKLKSELKRYKDEALGSECKVAALEREVKELRSSVQVYATIMKGDSDSSDASTDGGSSVFSGEGEILTTRGDLGTFQQAIESTQGSIELSLET